jgi:site-specific DNA recombinase
VTQSKEQIRTLEGQVVDPVEVSAAMSSFSPLWEQLTPREQERVIRLLVERVDYDGAAGTVAITFRPGGVKALAKEHEQQEAA